MRRLRLMVFGIAFLLGPFADCAFHKAEAAGVSESAGAADSAPPVPGQEQPEVLTRGPVHEAFAEPVTLRADEGLVSRKQPPDSIGEIPLKEKPEGGDFIWVPGYWSWDGERSNYIWVSGCWRIAPPKMSWVSGYWTRTGTGWRWVSGFWMQAGNNEIEYLEAPPAAVDIEPSGPPPVADSIWVPGCWYWSHDRYVSRSGYWLQGRADWVWVPSHYVWTPRGYVFSNGHWDYALERRGVLFAPVYFPSSVVYTRPGFRYSLGVVVDLGVLRVNLFCYPRYSHYYFGDYYDDASIRIGIFPCFESERRHTWYDPVYQYDKWRSRDPRWEEHERSSYELRRNDRDLRPSRTYREQENKVSKSPESQRDNFQISRPVTASSQAKSEPRKSGQRDDDARQKTFKQANDVQNYREERKQWESTDTSSKGGQSSVERVKVEDSRSAQTSERRGDFTVKYDRGNDGSSRSTQKTPDRNVSAAQSERVKDTTSKSAPSYAADQGDSSYSRSERVRVPDSPVSDRVSSYTGGDRYPSTPSEERRSQDGGRDSRGDEGQRGRSRESH